MNGHNKVRFQRLGGLLKAIRLPWVVVGDFNMEPDILAASRFVQNVHGVIRTAGPEGTCANPQGRDKVLDYVLCSPEATPFLKTICAVRA
eukprot:8212180-Pyramimonas_sp.AAC.1